MPSNTLYNPQNIKEFEAAKLAKNALGVAQTVSLNTTTTLDLTIEDDCLITNGFLLVKNGYKGDYVDFQLLYAGNVIWQFITQWYINPDVVEQVVPKSNYPAKIIAGMTLRVIYYSSGGETSPWVAVNYDLDLVLV